MSNFPSDYDDDTTLPIVNDDITEIGGEAINALRDAVFNIEQNVGLTANGSTSSIADRLGISLNPDGTIKPSAIASLGLVSLPITEDQISNTANIPESKLRLDHRTQDLYNYIEDLSRGVNTSTGWISVTGVKLDPHLMGALYRHTLDQIDISSNSSAFLKNKFRVLRDNTNFYTLVNDINDELLEHQWADGSIFGTIEDVVTNDGSTYPSNYAHTSSGIFLNTSRFTVIPQTAQDLQQFAEFIDSSSIFLIGTRIQNLYSNGISKVSRSSTLSVDGYGAPIVPPTSAIAYLLGTGTASSPVDDINTGDDIIEFKPSSADMASNSFDEKFSLVKPGDIVRINYGTIQVQFIIKEKKYIQNGINKKYIVRIAGKNLFYTTNAVARIDRSLVNSNKYGVLAVAGANNSFSQLPSLIVGSPRGAQALGIGFNADQFDTTHYLLYLALYPTGHPEDGYTILPGIDVTGNRGTTPGLYTLESIVESTNDAFRAAGYNYRFIAFSYQGEFGIMLADAYNNTAFSVLSAVVDSNGFYNETATNIVFQNNVVGMFAPVNATAPDPLGFGPLKGGIASPPYMSIYGSAEAALNATKIYLPLSRNNYYVNGTEKDKLFLEEDQVLDGYGDGYWVGTVLSQNVFPGPNGRVETTYRINLDLTTSNLKIGKTLVVQSVGEGSLVDFGRFIIKGITFGCPCPSPGAYTDITVFDAVHGTGVSPSSVLAVGSEVGIYFNSDSVAFNIESATDSTPVSPFKRHFEVYIDQDGRTFTQERARINISGSTMLVNDVPLYTNSELAKLNIVNVSPKLQGYQFGSVNKISLNITNYSDSSGLFDGYLASYNGTNLTKVGNRVFGRKGEITRFYDESNIDFIDIIFDINIAVSDFISQVVDIQLFPSLATDDEIMLVATCQVNDSTNRVTQIRDKRQFGNTSEKDLSTSALNLISLPEKLLHANGVVRGFDLDSSTVNPNGGQIFLKGGVALVNGKIIQVNNQTVTIPQVKELNGAQYNINWAVCVNDKSEYQIVPLLDYDPILDTPSDVDRVFRAYNVVSGSLYYIDATTFPDLITKRKDLAVLYIAASTVTNTPSITLSVTDARRFVNNETINVPFTLVPNDGTEVPGHFKSFDAAINWINKFGTDNNTIIIRGNHNLTSTIDLTNILHPVTFKGENSVLNISTSKGFLINQNVTFDNITFNYNPLIFNDTTTLINGDAGCIFSDGYTNSSNIKIQNCYFDSGTINHPPFICFNIAAEKYVDNLRISNNIFNDTGLSYNCAIGFLSTFEGTTFTYMPTIANVSIESNICNQAQTLFAVSKISNITFKGKPGLAALNVQIRNNIFGYIGYTVSSNSNYNPNVSGTVNHQLLIDSNSALAIISPVDQTGTISTISPGFPSGEVTINNNKLNYVETYWCQNNDGYASLTISNNSLLANEYNVIMGIFGLSTSIVPGAAISVTNNSSTTVTTIKTKIINNNMSANKVGSTNYYFNRGIDINVPAIIDNNVISGLVSDSVNTVGISSSLGQVSHYVITNNYIYRNTADIFRYISVGFLTTIGEITDNFIDSSYTDEANTNISTIFGSSTMIIDRNVNQIITRYVRPINDGRISYSNATIAAPSDGYVTLTNSDGYPISTLNYSIALSVPGDSSARQVIWQVDLKDVVPFTAKVIYVATEGLIQTTSDFTVASSTLTLLSKNHTGSDTTVGSDTYNFIGGGPTSGILEITSASNLRSPDLYTRLVINGTSSVFRTIYHSALTVQYKY